MNRRNNVIPAKAVALALFFAVSPAFARPLLTEEVETVGHLNFEAETSVSQRQDKFGTPERNYESVHFPFGVRLGITSKGELGFTLRHVSHRYRNGGTRLSGASKGDFSPDFKISPWTNLGFQAIWYISQSENLEEEMSVAHGNDLEVNALIRVPTPVVQTHINIGHIWRGNYNSQFGVPAGTLYNVDPGNISQAKLAFEYPLPAHLSVLLEGAYYSVKAQSNNGIELPETDGEAADVLVGMSWAYGGWTLGAGAAFGLLDESHTSFDLLRGAGDYTYKFSLAYKLKPRRPTRDR